MGSFSRPQCISELPSSMLSQSQGGMMEGALVPVSEVSKPLSRLQKLQERTREEMREEVQQILQTNDHEQQLKAILASPITSFFAARAQVKHQNQTGPTPQDDSFTCNKNNANVLNRYQSLINPTARAQRVQERVQQQAQQQQKMHMEQLRMAQVRVHQQQQAAHIPRQLS